MSAIRHVASVLLAFALYCPFAEARQSPAEVLADIERNGRAAHSDAVLIQKDGVPLLDVASTSEPIHLMSATKSIMALAIGLLLDDGKLASLDEPVSAIYPEWRQGQKRDITVRMLLEHTSGLQNVPNAGVELESAPDLVQLALAAEITSVPGSAFSYNNKATNLLPGIIARLAGQPVDAYLEARLFRPLGITRYDWMKDEAGTPLGMAGLSLSARDLAAIGQLMLDGGVAKDGTRLMSEHAISLMTVESAQSADVGLLWWRLPEWERYTLRNDAQRTLRERGVSDRLLHALLAAEGSTFASKSALMAHLSQQLGDDWQPLYATEVTGRGLKIADLFQSQRGPVSAYAANGYLGQHLVVVPEQRIVAVRLIQRRESHAFPVDDYATFPAEIIRLAKSMPALAAPATDIGGAQHDVAVHTKMDDTASPIRL